MFSDSTDLDKVGDTDQEAAEESEKSVEANKAQAFITQLEKQRSEQLAEIDRDIEKLQSQEASATDGGEDSPVDEEAAMVLASLQATRKSIMSEYDAMIDAARQRINTP